jgi:hypothetical protein
MSEDQGGLQRAITRMRKFPHPLRTLTTAKELWIGGSIVQRIKADVNGNLNLTHLCAESATWN